MHDRPETRQLLLNQLIQQKLIYLAALDEGLDRDPDVAALLQETRERALLSEYIKRNLRDDEPLTNSEIQAYYDERQDQYLGEAQVRLQHIRVKNKRKTHLTP